MIVDDFDAFFHDIPVFVLDHSYARDCDSDYAVHIYDIQRMQHMNVYTHTRIRTGAARQSPLPHHAGFGDTLLIIEQEEISKMEQS